MENPTALSAFVGKCRLLSAFPALWKIPTEKSANVRISPHLSSFTPAGPSSAAAADPSAEAAASAAKAGLPLRRVEASAKAGVSITPGGASSTAATAGAREFF